MKCDLGKFVQADNIEKLMGFHLLTVLLIILCS